jgi:hypothetical protein
VQQLEDKAMPRTNSDLTDLAVLGLASVLDAMAGSNGTLGWYA